MRLRFPCLDSAVAFGGGVAGDRQVSARRAEVVMNSAMAGKAVQIRHICTLFRCARTPCQGGKGRLASIVFVDLEQVL